MITKRNRFFSLSRIVILVAGTIAILYALHLYYVQKNKLMLYKQEIENLKIENAKLEKILNQVDTPFMTEKNCKGTARNDERRRIQTQPTGRKKCFPLSLSGKI